VAGDNIDVLHATSQTSPTIVLASPATVTAYLKHPDTKLPGGVGKFMTQRTLQQGNMPAKQPSSATPLSHLRVLLIPQSTTSPASTRLSSSTLHTLRTLLKCRIGYALTAPHVAGAISQTNIFDYREKAGNVVCVGAPLSSVEVHLSGEEDVVGTRAPKGTVSLTTAFLHITSYQRHYHLISSHAIIVTLCVLVCFWVSGSLATTVPSGASFIHPSVHYADRTATRQMTVKGPAVVGGKTTIDGLQVQIDEDHTLLLL
jgi:hypothetical protein